MKQKRNYITAFGKNYDLPQIFKKTKEEEDKIVLIIN